MLMVSLTRKRHSLQLPQPKQVK